jgi:16S rRNA (adenine1518-N6/adenine1519-N6)-dimethyltransferase
MIGCARFDRSCRVLEIGPGLGALTIPLAGSVQHIVAVEKDPHLAEILSKNLSREGIENVTLINGDILKLDLNDMGPFSGRTLQVIGNLPYNISSPVLEKLITNRERVTRAILTFQLEFSRRLIASPGNREYGAMSVLTQYYAHISPLLEIPKEAFYPRPKVGSMVLELDFARPYPRRAEDEKNFRRIVRAAFAHRRKTLINSLRGSLPSTSIEEIMKALGRCAIDPQKRAETLDIDDFLCLNTALASLS